METLCLCYQAQMQPYRCRLQKIESNCHHRFYCFYTGWVDIRRLLCVTWPSSCSQRWIGYNVEVDVPLRIQRNVCRSEYMDSDYSCKRQTEEHVLSMPFSS